MEIARLRSFLLDRGMLYFYVVFIAGYFLLPMAAGHRRLYYILVMPAVLLLWRELRSFYRGNSLFTLLLAYALYMMSSLLWSANFDAAEAYFAILYSVALLTFCLISGFLWMEHSQRMDHLAHRSVWLAALAAAVSIIAWYLDHPFPESRLEPLGVMHHQNKAACAYGIFLVLCMHYLFSERGRDNKLVYATLGAVLLSLVVFTQSRTALAGVGVALLVLLGYRALALLALALPASWALLAANPQAWEHRVANFSFRPGIWQQVLADMEGHWWFGRGYMVDPVVAAYEKTFDHAHNAYLASLRDGGIVGLALLTGILALAALWAIGLYRQRGERIYLALLLYGMTCIVMDFDRLLVHPKEIWMFFWLPIALIMAAYPRREGPGAGSLPWAGMRTEALRCALCCLCLLLPGMPVASAGTAAAPAWRVLEFEQRAFWAVARSRVEIPRADAGQGAWNLTATSSVLDNAEEVTVSFMPASGAALQRTRLSRGKDQRFKTFTYRDDHILRERRDPADDPNTPPDQWPLSSRKKIAHPDTLGDRIITDAYALLLLADRLQAGTRDSAEMVVHTEFNFYRVRMTCGNGIPIDADYRIGGGERVRGRRETRAVALQIDPLGPQVDKPDFSLLGLEGDIILFFDKVSGLLLQVRGTAPRIGSTEINLKAATLREPAT